MAAPSSRRTQRRAAVYPEKDFKDDLRMNLLLFDGHDLVESSMLRISGERARHLLKVQRVTPGERLRVGLISGPRGTALVARLGPDEVVLQLEALDCPPEESLVDLIAALPRPQILKRVLHTAAMMGVRRLHLVGSARVEKSYFSSPLLQPEKMHQYLVQGLEQAVATNLPEVTIHPRLRRFLDEELPAGAAPETELLLPHPGAPLSLAELGLTGRLTAGKQVLLAVGPEGGWTDEEVERFGSCGFRAFHCGRRILRVDAAVCSLLGQVDLIRAMNGRGPA